MEGTAAAQSRGEAGLQADVTGILRGPSTLVLHSKESHDLIPSSITGSAEKRYAQAKSREVKGSSSDEVPRAVKFTETGSRMVLSGACVPLPLVVDGNLVRSSSPPCRGPLRLSTLSSRTPKARRWWPQVHRSVGASLWVEPAARGCFQGRGGEGRGNAGRGT